MSKPYTTSDKSYWIVAVAVTRSIEGAKKGEPGAWSLVDSVPVEGTGNFRPGAFLQQYVRRRNGGRGREQNDSTHIVSIVETTREDLEAYCQDFDAGRWLYDLDETKVGDSSVTTWP